MYKYVIWVSNNLVKLQTCSNSLFQVLSAGLITCNLKTIAFIVFFDMLFIYFWVSYNSKIADLTSLDS